MPNVLGVSPMIIAVEIAKGTPREACEAEKATHDTVMLRPYTTCISLVPTLSSPCWARH